MATRSEVHTWLKALQGPAAGPAGSKVALAVCIYLAQPDIPDVASFLGAELSSVSSCETGPEQDMQLSVGGRSYRLPRLPDPMCCPVGGWGREMFMAMNPAMTGAPMPIGSGLDDIMNMMSKKMFSAAGDGSVLTVEQFCTVLGKAMKAADGVKRKGNAVLSYLSRTREGWDSSEDMSGVSRSGLPPHRQAGSARTAHASTSRAGPGANTMTTDSGSKSNEACSVCGNSGKMKSCSRCKRVKYCSVACQTSDWKAHKPSCQRA